MTLRHARNTQITIIATVSHLPVFKPETDKWPTVAMI
jgi:hypothetical protein